MGILFGILGRFILAQHFESTAHVYLLLILAGHGSCVFPGRYNIKALKYIIWLFVLFTTEMFLATVNCNVNTSTFLLLLLSQCYLY